MRSQNWSNLETSVVNILVDPSRRSLKAKELAQILEISGKEYPAFKKVLTDMEQRGIVHQVRGHRYAVPKSVEMVRGVIEVAPKGHGFVRSKEGQADVYVPRYRLGSAMSGDTVCVRIHGRPQGRNPEGAVVSVLKRGRNRIVGVYQKRRGAGSVTPVDSRLRLSVQITGGGGPSLREGQVVVVRILSYEEGGRAKLSGVIEEVLGDADDSAVQILAVAHTHGLAQVFADDVMEEARVAAKEGSSNPGDARVDRTSLLTFTIDPSDAKDHDDALSIERLDVDRVEVGIHIADVSHFVDIGSAVDTEAYARGTSVYLVDRTIPMLPTILANDVCSLKTGVPRFALSVFVTLDSEGQVHGHRYEHTIIKCRAALSYEEAQEVIDGNASIDPEVDGALNSLLEYAQAIRALRVLRGSLDLDLPEVEVIIGPKGEPIDIRRRQRLETHRVIEDFMILANEVVAEDFEKKGIDGLYRVHEPPAPEKMERLSETLTQFGFMKSRGRLSPSEMQETVCSVKGKPEEALVNILVLRSLRRASYSSDNVGHFGLGSLGYTHFTSPIRRYPDLVVHRMVSRCLIHGEESPYRDSDSLKELASHCSVREQAAVEAERESVAFMKTGFMESRLGEEYRGQITGVAAFGLFVTLDDIFIEGMIPVATMMDDYYRFEEAEYALVGERGHRRFRLGDSVSVQVARVDIGRRQTEFALLENSGL